MNNYMHSFFSRVRHSPILRCTAVMLVTLAWSSLAFCGEIHDAAKSGDLEKVKTLLKDNPDLVSSKDDKDCTPLHLAATWGHKDVAELLLANKAEVNAKDFLGATPLLRAALMDHKDVAELLLASNAEVNVKDNKGRTPLHWAVFAGHKDVAELLLASKADVNAKDNEGDTPLQYAALIGHKEVAELLIAKKADVNAKDNKGDTPLLQAIQMGHDDVAEMLRQHGGQEPTPAATTVYTTNVFHGRVESRVAYINIGNGMQRMTTVTIDGKQYSLTDDEARKWKFIRYVNEGGNLVPYVGGIIPDATVIFSNTADGRQKIVDIQGEFAPP